MVRSLITSRWARLLVGSLVCGVLAAAGVATGRYHWGARRTFGKAEAAWAEGDYRRAAALFREVGESYPEHRLAPEALFRLGRGTYLFLNDPREAVLVLRDLVRRESSGVWARQAQRLLGEIFEVRQGDCRQAIVEYQRMISLDPRGEGNDEAQLAVARCSFALGDYDQARAEYEMLLERYPESALKQRALAGIANTWYVTGHFAQAVQLYRQAQQESRDPALAAEAGFGIATSLEEAGDLAGALAQFERVRSTYPNPGLVEQRIARARERIAQQGGRATGSRNGGE
ncbi:MAG: tetratricopeptide repeat protein [Candidatus Methylomirabilia bacterium]